MSGLNTVLLGSKVVVLQFLWARGTRSETRNLGAEAICLSLSRLGSRIIIMEYRLLDHHDRCSSRLKSRQWLSIIGF